MIKSRKKLQRTVKNCLSLPNITSFVVLLIGVSLGLGALILLSFFELSDYKITTFKLGEEKVFFLKNKIEGSKTMVRTLSSFFYGSKMVDFEEFQEFIQISRFMNNSLYPHVIAIEWIPVVPLSQKSEFHNQVINAFKLSPSDTTELNSTQEITEDINFISSYIIKQEQNFKSFQKTKFFEIGENGKNKTSSNLFSKLEQFQERGEIEVSVNLDPKSPLFGTLQYLTTISKSLFNESLSCSACQTGVIRVSFDLDQLLTSLQLVDINFYLFTNDKLASKFPHSAPSDPFLSNFNNYFHVEDIHFTEKKNKNNFLAIQNQENNDQIEEFMFQVVLVPGISYLKSNFLFLKWIGLAIPIVFFVVIAGIVQIFNFAIKQRKELKIFTSVALGIQNLDFEAPEILQLIAKKPQNCSKIEKILKIILGDMNEYMQFLPQTLICSKKEGRKEEEIEELEGTSRSSITVEKILKKERDIDSISSDPIYSQNSYSSNTSSLFGSTKRSSSKSHNSKQLSTRRIQERIKTKEDVVLFYIYTENAESLFSDTNRPNGLNAKRAKFKNMFEKYISVVFGFLSSINANFHYFRNFEMLFSFNAVTNRVSVGLECVKIAQTLLKEKEFHDNNIKMKIIIIKGKMTVGNFTIFKDYKKKLMMKPAVKNFDIFGPKRFLIHKLKKMNAERYHANIIIDEKIKEEIKYVASFRCLDVMNVQTKKPGKIGNEEESSKIYELLNCSTKDANEWLYEINTKLTTEEFANDGYDEKVLDCLSQGKLKEAKKIMRNVKEKDSHFLYIESKIREFEDSKNV